MFSTLSDLQEATLPLKYQNQQILKLGLKRYSRKIMWTLSTSMALPDII